MQSGNINAFHSRSIPFFCLVLLVTLFIGVALAQHGKNPAAPAGKGRTPSTPKAAGHSLANGGTKLIEAAMNGDFTVVCELIYLEGGTWKHKPDDAADLSECGEYIDCADNEGYTALMYAIKKHNVEIVNYLLKAGADPTKKCTKTQFTPLELAQNERDAYTVSAIERKLNEKSSFSQFIGESSTLLIWGFLFSSTSLPTCILILYRVCNRFCRRRAERQCQLIKNY